MSGQRNSTKKRAAEKEPEHEQAAPGNPNPRKRNKTMASNPAPVTRFQPYRKCAQKDPRFPYFTKLPRELRDNIYGHLLQVPNHEAIDAAGVWNQPPIKNIGWYFQVNRQIGGEAAHYFYSSNNFCFLEGCDEFAEDHDDITLHRLYLWLDKIGQTNCLSIRCLQLRIRSEREVSYYTELLTHVSAQIPNLKRLGLVMEIHHHLMPASADDVEDDMDTDEAVPIDFEPNFIVPLNRKTIDGILKGLGSLSLKALLVAYTRTHVKFVQSLPLLAMCKVLAIEPRYARRPPKQSEKPSEPCANFFALKPWFESPGDSYSQKIRHDMCHSSQLVDQFFKGIPTGDVGPEIQDEDTKKPNFGNEADGENAVLQEQVIEHY
ncbi:hypothetical protein V8F06_004207 [Rhypophila decipiens]